MILAVLQYHVVLFHRHVEWKWKRHTPLKDRALRQLRVFNDAVELEGRLEKGDIVNL